MDTKLKKVKYHNRENSYGGNVTIWEFLFLHEIMYITTFLKTDYNLLVI